MKGLEKLTTIRLAEVLTQKGAVPSEALTDALYTQDKTGEPFCQILVNGGFITEWDLAKIVCEAFQLPFLMASSYDVKEETTSHLPKELLFKHQIVPLDVFGNVVTVLMPVLTPFEALAKIQKEHNVEFFPYVGLFSENKKFLGEKFDDFSAWLKTEEAEREKRASSASDANPLEGDWMNIFDAGDQATKSPLG